MKISSNLQGSKSPEITRGYQVFEPRTMTGLIEKVKNHWSPHQFKDGHRHSDNWIGSDFLFADVDNVDTETQLSIEDFKVKFSGVESFLITSRNHQKEKKNSSDEKNPYPAKDRYHVLFPLGYTCTDKDKYQKNQKLLVDSNKEFDKACKDLGRFFYGCDDVQVIKISGQKMQLKDFEPIEIEVSKPKIAPSFQKSFQDESLKTRIFNLLSQAANSGRFSSYEDWRDLGFAMREADEGFSLSDYQALSDGMEKTNKDCETVWNSRDYHGKKITGGSLVELCREVDQDFLIKGPPINPRIMFGGSDSLEIKPETDQSEFVDITLPPSFETEEKVLAALRNAGLETKRQRKFTECPEAYDIVISNDSDFKRVLRIDRATNKTVSFYDSIDDVYTAVMQRMQFYGLDPSMNRRRDIVSKMKLNKFYRFNSVERFINDLSLSPNKGIDSLREMLSYFKYKNEDDRGMYEELFRIWFTRSAIHIIGSLPSEKTFPGDWCLVFVGGQGIGKGRFCKFISVDRNYYIDLGNNQDATLGSKDFFRIVAGKIIGELGEMSFQSKSSAEATKAVISSEEDGFTPKYQEEQRIIRRSICFIGTTNSDKFLQDLTGARRFWPIHIEKIDPSLFDKVEIARSVWSYFFEEAKTILKSGDHSKIEPNDAFKVFFDQIKRDAMQTSPNVEIYQNSIVEIEKSFHNGEHGKNKQFLFFSNTEIYQKAREFSGNPNFKSQFDLKKAAEDFGYVYKKGRSNQHGHVVDGWGIAIDNEKLIKRKVEIYGENHDVPF